MYSHSSIITRCPAPSARATRRRAAPRTWWAMKPAERTVSRNRELATSGGGGGGGGGAAPGGGSSGRGRGGGAAPGWCSGKWTHLHESRRLGRYSCTGPPGTVILTFHMYISSLFGPGGPAKRFHACSHLLALQIASRNTYGGMGGSPTSEVDGGATGGAGGGGAGCIDPSSRSVGEAPPDGGGGMPAGGPEGGISPVLRFAAIQAGSTIAPPRPEPGRLALVDRPASGLKPGRAAMWLAPSGAKTARGRPHCPAAAVFPAWPRRCAARGCGPM